MRKLLQTTFLLLVGYVIMTSQSGDQKLNNRPIIGILAQHFHPDNPFPVPGDCYISASYVKFVESAGARVVPIKINQEPAIIEKLLSSVNGVLFPGGDSDVMNSPFQRNAKAVFEYAVKQRNTGNYFPIWGTCMGFQQLSVLAAQSNILTASKGTWDTAMELSALDRSGRLTRDMSDELSHAVRFEPLTYNAHYNCVSIDAYKKNENLQSFFKVLSTNVDSDGENFISTFEANDFPIYGVQWHPEMNSFEFDNAEGLGPNVPHTSNAVLLAQYMANFFVNEARKNFNQFESKEEEQKHLIYNYQTVFSAKYNVFGEQKYVFN